MEMRVRYQKGIFKPLQRVRGIKEGEVLSIFIERQYWSKLAMHNPSFSFLKHEPDIYSKTDVVKE